MKFNQYTWGLYKQTDIGKKTISLFENAAHDISIYELVSKYNPMEAKFSDKDSMEDCCELLWELAIKKMLLPTNIDNARNLYE